MKEDDEKGVVIRERYFSGSLQSRERVRGNYVGTGGWDVFAAIVKFANLISAGGKA